MSMRDIAKLMPPYVLDGVTDADYAEIESQLPAAIAMSRLTSNKIYVIDYSKKDFYYVSDAFANFVGIVQDELLSMGFNMYEALVSEEDFDLLADINKMQYELLGRFSGEEMKEYTFSCDFHFRIKGNLWMINHRLTPFAVKDGKVWLALCAVSMSSSDTCGNVIIHKSGSTSFHMFNRRNGKWEEKPRVAINELERGVIVLSAQGKTMKEIADILCRSEDSVKSYKRSAFKKLGVTNITQAITRVICYQMF